MGGAPLFLKTLGTTSISIPEVGIGTSDYHAGPEPLRRGLAEGAFLDTAASYGSEPVVAEAIRGIRDRVFVATKVSRQNLHSQALRRSVELSLQRLRVDVIDLLQLHEPNPGVPIEETIGAMTEMVDAGKVRFIGVSNFSLAQLQEAQRASKKYPIVSNQVRYNIIDRTIEKDLLPYCQANRITIIAYSPLARGLHRVQDCDSQQAVELLAKETGKTSAQIILNWCLCKEGVVVIPRANSTARIVENCGASDWRLSARHLALLDDKIQYRRRSRLGTLVKPYIHFSVKEFALRMVKYLPRAIRGRVI